MNIPFENVNQISNTGPQFEQQMPRKNAHLCQSCVLD